MKLAYRVVDVFTTRPLEGNALAVVPDATGVDGRAMQRIAREFNLSETTFVLPAESDTGGTRVRIFTPGSELPFAGHPTIGTAWVLRELGIVAHGASHFVLKENVGDVAVRVDSGDDPLLWLTTPPIARLGTYSRGACARALKLDEDALVETADPQALSAGNPLIFVAVKDRDAVDRAAVDPAAFEALTRGCEPPTSLFVFAPVEAGAYSRMFAPELGIVEDPATGSATGPLAAYMMAQGLVGNRDGTRFVSEQGVKMGRRSVLHVLVHGENGCDGIEVGGNVVPVASGTMEVPL